MQADQPAPPRRADPALPGLVLVALVAVVAQSPAVAGWFVQDDFTLLSRPAGQLPWPELPARPVSNLLVPAALWPLLGLSSLAWHLWTLALAALAAALASAVGHRVGLPGPAARLAGLLVAGSPLLFTPVFWVAASAELLGMVLLLAALLAWSRPGAGWAAATATLAAGAALSKESALAAPIVLAAASAFLPERFPRWTRARALALAGALLAAGVAGWLSWQAIPHGPGRPYELGGLSTVLHNLAATGRWLLWPWSTPPTPGSLALALGGALWLGLAGAGLAAWRRGHCLVPVAVLWALAVLAPALPLRQHLQPYYLVGALPPLGLLLAWALRDRVPRRTPVQAGILATMALVAVLAAWAGSQPRLRARDNAGVIADDLVRRAGIARENAQRLRALPPAGEVVVLQALPGGLPGVDALPRDGRRLIAGTPVYIAFDGEHGATLALGREGVPVRWAAHLDDSLADAQVFLDHGGLHLRPLGDLRNARIHSALIAIAGGQRERARHDLWAVVGAGAEVPFSFDPDALAFDPAILDEEVPRFLSWLELRDDSPAGRRSAKLLRDVHEAIAGR